VCMHGEYLFMVFCPQILRYVSSTGGKCDAILVPASSLFVLIISKTCCLHAAQKLTPDDVIPITRWRVISI
jgi:hypothetical protein